MWADLQGQNLVLAISCLTALSFMLIGYDNGVIGGLTNAPSWNLTFRHPTGSALSTIVAIYEVGCFAGSLLALVVGERLGRKSTIRLGSLWMIVGGLLQTFAYSRPQMIVGRIVSGIGMGCINSSAPVLQAEVSPKASRGRYACAQLSTLNFGIFLSYWIDYSMTKHFEGPIAFRFPIGFQLVLVCPIFLLTYAVPESPRWLLYHGHPEKALNILTRLESEAADPQNEIVQVKYRQMVSNVAYEKSIQVKGCLELFKNDDLATRKRLLIACSVQFFQQLGGINGIIYYANFIFANSLGFSADMASFMSGLLFTWFFVASFIPWFLIDTIGRRKLLIGSATVMALVLALLSAMIKRIEENSTQSYVYGILASLLCFLYMSTFTTGFQGTVWVYPPEILPLRIRAKGTALATACNWIINFAVVEVFPPAIEKIGWKVYVIFMAFNFSFVPIMYLFYPETKGKSLEEIDMLFGDAVSIQIQSDASGRGVITIATEDRAVPSPSRPTLPSDNEIVPIGLTHANSDFKHT